jgi:hypothetical protein
VPEKPAWSGGQVVTLNEPKLTGGSIVTERLSMALTARESSTVTEPNENVPVELGVPVKVIVAPESTAVSPVGRPLCEMRV